jgi:hypothetical protein
MSRKQRFADIEGDPTVYQSRTEKDFSLAERAQLLGWLLATTLVKAA